VATTRSATPPGREAWRYLYDILFSDESHEKMHQACESLGLTPGLMKALISMQPDESKPMKMLATQWRCDASYVTSLVDGLEERGLVERRLHPTDRRAKTIALTSEGDRTRLELLDRLHEPPPGLAALTLAEQRTLRDLLAKIVNASQAQHIDRSAS
jgi:DNA-binding MarR family transcriptional regulator